MAPAIELVPVSQGAIKTQRCAKGAPRALDEIEVPTQGNAPALRARRNPRSNPPALRFRRYAPGAIPVATRRRSAPGAIPPIKNPRFPSYFST